MDLAKIVGSSPIGVALFVSLLYSEDADCGDELLGYGSRGSGTLVGL